MPATSEAFINADVLKWARKRANTTTDRVARSLNVKPESVISWESGEKNPSYSQAERLAKALHVPFVYLFLPARPKEKVPIADFRTVGNKELEEAADLIDLLNDVLVKHGWYREFIEGEGRASLDFVGSFDADDDAEAIASDIADRLGVTDELRKSCSSWEDFLTKLIVRAQGAGILVMRSGTVSGNTHRPVSPNIFRGFTISDKFAPLVFINSADFKAAQIFTLAHELSHVWIGATGISNEDLEGHAASAIERKCDAVAAQLLVPANDFLARWSAVNENASQLARRYRVSTLVILRRARDLGKISQTQFKERFKAEKKKYKKAKGGGDYYNNLLARNGEIFTGAVLSALNEGKELYRDAAKLLNISVNNIPKVAEVLATRSKSG